MSLTITEIKERLCNYYDPDDICEALELTTEMLLDKFEDRMVQYLYKFKEELEDDEEEFED